MHVGAGSVAREHEAYLASSIIDTGLMIFPRPTECFAGDEALARGAWAEARAAYEAVLRDQRNSGGTRRTWNRGVVA